MNTLKLARSRVENLLSEARKTRVLVIGDVMLDQFIWGAVSRVSPEAPVPVVDFARESYMPGGAANVARNLADMGVSVEIMGAVGADAAADQLRLLLREQGIGCSGLIAVPERRTSLKTRIVAHQQQVVRVDRESRDPLDGRTTRHLMSGIMKHLPDAAAVIVGDYGKGVVTQELLDNLKLECRKLGVWLSLDPKPVHRLNLEGLSLITPNRKEAFELARMEDTGRSGSPLEDAGLMAMVEGLLGSLKPAVLLVTLSEQGMLLCQRGHAPLPIPTVAQEVFDVSGAGDTAIAAFTLAVAAGASPVEAAIVANHASGIVVGKVGTATATPAELLASFQK
jgi:D-beta-D-heptose 7-phosphate kinase/D-beta-D-heptose 1-phosphate adenosyltransferase